MRLVLSPKSESCSVSYLQLLKTFKDYEDKQLSEKLMNDFVYDQIFVLKFFKLLNYLYPEDFTIQINTFVQEYTLKKLLEWGIPLTIVKLNHDVEKYYSGDCFIGLYKRLKKEKLPVEVYEEPYEIECANYNLDEICYIALYLEREVKNVGLSDVIKAASDNLRKSSSEPIVADGELSRAMKEMGLDLETGESFMNRPEPLDTPKSTVQPTKKEKPKKAESKPTKKVESVQDTNDSDENDICYKISDGKIAILIPVDTPLDTVELNGVKFQRLVTAIPDVNSSKLQVMKVLPEVSAEEQPSIIRKPIFLKKEEQSSVKPQVSYEYSEDLDEWKKKKQELDEAIAEARKSGGDTLVNELRKQRRKVRGIINKLKAEGE